MVFGWMPPYFVLQNVVASCIRSCASCLTKSLPEEVWITMPDISLQESNSKENSGLEEIVGSSGSSHHNNFAGLALNTAGFYFCLFLLSVCCCCCFICYNALYYIFKYIRMSTNIYECPRMSTNVYECLRIARAGGGGRDAPEVRGYGAQLEQGRSAWRPLRGQRRLVRDHP